VTDAVGGFVNAVLRGAARDREAIEQALGELQAADPATGWSHPAWLVERWLKAFGAEAVKQLLVWDNTPPETYVRTVPQRLAPDKLTELWQREDVVYEAKRYPWVNEPLVFQLKRHPGLASLRSFKLGGFYVQDPSTLLAVRELAPKPGETVLDLCAAPGGKTTYIAQLMDNQGTIVAHDPSQERLRLVRENASRLGFSCIAPTHVAPSPARDANRFDRVLVDAPCSNTGVLRRRIEARWRLQPTELPKLAETQLQLLKDGAALLKSGGRLVYSTCSLETDENRGVVEQFLDRALNMSFVREQQLTPWKDHVDGAYIAVLTKN
jgi:16S rRNA (cytosine967-C5)-methyltransferase